MKQVLPPTSMADRQLPGKDQPRLVQLQNDRVTVGEPVTEIAHDAKSISQAIMLRVDRIANAASR